MADIINIKILEEVRDKTEELEAEDFEVLEITFKPVLITAIKYKGSNGRKVHQLRFTWNPTTDNKWPFEVL